MARNDNDLTYNESRFALPDLRDSLSDPANEGRFLVCRIDEHDFQSKRSREFTHQLPSIRSIRQRQDVDVTEVECGGVNELALRGRGEMKMLSIGKGIVLRFGKVLVLRAWGVARE